MIGILAAMDVEVEAITALADITETKTIAGCEMHYGKIKDEDFVILKTGVGKTHAAMATTILCMNESPDWILNVGIGGGLKEECHVMDFVLADQMIQADFDLRPVDGPDALGLRYDVDPDLLKWGLEAAKRAELPVHVGAIATQDLFLARPEDVDFVTKHFPEAYCAEMEGAAVAQVANDFHIPFLAVRTLSDVVMHHENDVQYWNHKEEASRHLQHWISEMI